MNVQRARMAALFVTLAAAAYAQEFRASISGSVTDPSGASVVGAKVLVTDVQKNTRSEAVTNEVGFYSIPFLLPSRYTVSVEASGFKKYLRKDIELGANDKLGMDVTLEVGAMTESVTVTGQASMLQTETASRGGAVEQRLVQDMPNPGRNMFNVVFTMPGVYKPSVSQGNGFDIGSGIGNANPQINGASQGTNGRGWNTEVLMDGLANNRATKEVVSIPALETVQEIQVLTNMYDAAYGHTGGGVVSVITKSGTNDFHGVVFDRVTDNKWRANTWVENSLGRTKNVARFHNYGFMVNGPVSIPKLVNGKDKLFFMLSWDKSPRDGNYFQYSNMPTALMKKGDFSRLFGAGGRQIVVNDPLTTRLEGGRYVRTPFAGNVIPVTQIDPVGAKMVGYYPDPNITGGGVTGMERNFLNEGIQHDMTAQWSGRLDYRLNSKHSFFGRFTVTDQHRDGAYRFGALTPAEPERDLRGDGGRQATFDWTAILSPTTTWSLRAGFARFEETAGSDRNAAFDPATFGWPSSLVRQFTGKHFPSINYGSLYNRMGSGQINDLIAANTYTAQPSFGKVFRSHVMKFGGEIREYQLNRLTVGLPSGSLAFSKLWTQSNPLQGDAFSGDEIATALLGYASGQFEVPIAPAHAYRYYVAYFQDDWKVTQKLSLNLGLRWDYETPPVERFNRMLRGFAFSQSSPISAQVKTAPGAENCPACANLLGGPLFAAVGGQPNTAFNPDRNNIQPRVGVAYTLNPKTVFRAGYGLYYMALSSSEAGESTGFSQTTPIITSPDGLTPDVRISDPLAGRSLIQPIGASQGLATNLGLGTTLNYIPRHLPRSHMISVGFQRQLPLDINLDASYVANYSTGLPVGSVDMNFVPASQFGQPVSYYTAQVTNPFRGLLPLNSALNGATIQRSQLMGAYPHFPGRLTNLPIGKNRHDSFQLQARRRFGNGLTIQANYTISKTLEQLQLLNPQDLNLTDFASTRLDKRLTPFDIPQRLSVIGVYDLPFGKGRKYASTMPYALNLFLGGWTMGWNITHQAGFPLEFPNAAPLAARSAKLSDDERTVYRWFDTSLFPKVAGPAPFTLRNFSSRFPDVRFMSLDTWDLNLSKDIPIMERVKGQIRVNLINAANHPYLTQMASYNVTASNFGQLNVTSQGNPSRTINFDFKLVF